MTTIAYKDGLIAYDSRITQGDTIIDDNHDKSECYNKVRFFLAGPSCTMDDIISMYFGGKFKEITSNALAYDYNIHKLFLVGVGSYFWKDEIKKDRIAAIGSGTDHALTAMDMGATAEEAVEMAMKRDICTGGVIRIYNI